MIKKICASFVLLAFVALDASAGVALGKVVGVKYLVSQNVVLLQFAAHESKPSCATWSDSLAISYANSEQAKAVLSIALAAQSSGKQVRVVGTGVCVPSTSAEGISDIQVFD